MLKREMNSLPKSVSEARALGHNLYFTGKPCAHGHITYRYVADRICSDCAKAKVKKASTVGGGNARRWANKTAEQKTEIYKKRKAYYERTKEARRKEKRGSYTALKENPGWVQARREKTKTYRFVKGRPLEKSNPKVKRKYKQTMRGKVTTRANDAKRRTAKMQRTPAWLGKDDYWMLEQAYELAALRTKLFGFSWHVDHVLPLQGKKVSGLHVPTNVQVIPGVENVRKANRFMPA